MYIFLLANLDIFLVKQFSKMIFVLKNMTLILLKLNISK